MKYAGAAHGEMFQVEGEGLPSQRRGGRPGNLMLQVRSTKLHMIWEVVVVGCIMLKIGVESMGLGSFPAS